MSDQRMDVFLLAIPQEGVERSTLVKNLAKAFKKDFQSVEKMLRRSRTLVKSDVGLEVATKYKTVIEKAGGQCELVSQGTLPPVSKPMLLTGNSIIPSPPKKQIVPLTPIVATKTPDNLPDFDAVASYCISCDTAIRLGQTRCAKCSVAEYAPEESKLSVGNIATAVSMVIIFGIMAAIAFPAYTDYTTREKIKKSMPLVTNAYTTVGSFIKKTRSYPNENILVGLPDKINDPVIESIKLRDEAFLEVTYRFPHMKEKNTILWTPIDTNNGIGWSCKGGTMDDRYRLKECWMGNEAGTTNTANELTKNFLSKDKKMSIGMPASWKVKNLMPNATLSFANDQEQTYVAIIADSKEEFTEETTLVDYVSVVQQQLAMNTRNGELARESRKIILKKLPAERFLYRGEVDGVKMSYVVTLFEAGDHFYRVLAWTPQSRWEKNKALLENVSRSIRIQ